MRNRLLRGHVDLALVSFTSGRPRLEAHRLRAFAKFLCSEIDRFGKVIRAAGANAG